MLFVCNIFCDNPPSDCGCSTSRKSKTEYTCEKDCLTEDIDNLHSNKYSNFINMQLIKKENFYMGEKDILIHADGEGPQRLVTVDDFYIDKYEVSNGQFLSFTEATGYKTEVTIK